jgi:hypothetical protein
MIGFTAAGHYDDAARESPLERGMQRFPSGLKDPNKIIAACKPPVEKAADGLPVHPDSNNTGEWVFRIADAMTPTAEICGAALFKAKKLLAEHLKTQTAKRAPLEGWDERKRKEVELHCFSPVRRRPKGLKHRHAKGPSR